MEQRVKDNILHVPNRLSLHQRITGDSRKLREATSDWEVVEALRSWVYSNVCEQEEIEETLDQKNDFSFSAADAPEVFSAFQARAGGVWCGGIGQALRKLYLMYGFDAFVLDCGARDSGSTHISNLVRISHGGHMLWTVQDAYYEVGYVSPAGEPLGVLDMLALLRERRDDAVLAHEGPREARPLLSLGDETLLRASWRIDPPYPEGRPERILADGRLVFRTRPSIARLIEHGRADNLFDVLRDAGYPERLVYLYCLVFAVYPADAADAAELLDSMQACVAAAP
jgi:hypothetical protein